jgi:FkbM family methyltransferase
MFSKEPETIAWLNKIEEGAVLWDVGANIGLYSVYAAKVRKCFVYAFEPSVFNLEFLARNIQGNGLVDRVVVVPVSLNDKTSIARFELSTTAWGGALSTFQHGVTYDGSTLRTEFAYTTIGINMDQLAEAFGLRRPDYLKIDVDGIEHLVLRGGEEVLRTCRSLLIEINDDFDELAQSCSDLLTQAGLSLKSKEHSDDMATGRFANVYNQIWERA